MFSRSWSSLRRGRPWLLASLACLLGAAASAYLLKTLPYSSCLLETSDSPRWPLLGRSRDAAGNFAIDLRWYRQAPVLQPFRDLFASKCAGTDGVAAAICVNNVFAERFPFGAAVQDFCDRRYDPAADLARHLRGSPGHCMQRAGLLAATLLSAGVRARVIQFLYPRDGGHTLVEVRDPRRGWILVDPSTGSLVGTRRGPTSAAEVLRLSEAVRVWPAGKASLREQQPGSLYQGITGDLLEGHIVYPEPWLYTRTGPRESRWPFRGWYVVAGTPSWRLGAGQWSCQLAMLVCGALSAACAGRAGRLAWADRLRRGSGGRLAPARLLEPLCSAAPES